jgi:hypothetical protein
MAMAALALLATLCFASSVRADDVYVNDSANLLDDPSSAGHRLYILEKGDRLVVLDKQGDWIHVQYATYTGWVLAAEVSANRPVVGPMATAWAQGQNLDPSMCLKMEHDRDAINPQDVKDFQNSPEGKLGK